MDNDSTASEKSRQDPELPSQCGDDDHNVQSVSLANQKIRFENQKLELEIHLLGLPWWRKPGILAAVLPSVLAVGGLGLGIYTGYFEVESKLLETKTTLLGIQELQLGEAVATLQTARDDLKDEKIAIRAEVNSLQAQLGEVSEELRTAHVSRLLSELLEMDTYRSTDVVAKAIGEALLETEENLSENMSLIETALQNNPSKQIKGTLLLALYIGTKDKKYKDSLLTLADEMIQQPPENGNFWSLLSSQTYDYDDRIQILQRVHDYMRNKPDTRRNARRNARLLWIVWHLHVFTHHQSIRGGQLDYYRTRPRDYILAVRMARELMLSADNLVISEASATLKEIAPEAFVVACSSYFTRVAPLMVEYQGRGFVNDLGQIDLGLSDIPATIESSVWTTWRVNHSDLVDRWSGDLEKVAGNQALLDSILDGLFGHEEKDISQ